ncbi:MAG: hypothetical protein AAFR12_23470, partial [Cyanobacteria bacterium J06626_6]
VDMNRQSSESDKQYAGGRAAYPLGSSAIDLEGVDVEEKDECGRMKDECEDKRGSRKGEGILLF